MNNTKILKITSYIASLLLLFALMVSVMELFCCGRFWLESEYTRHPAKAGSVSSEFPDSTVDTEEAVRIAGDMMDYCFGRQASLDEDFFNQREKHHLADCRELFTGALRMRNIALAAGIVLLAFLLIRKQGALMKRGYMAVTKIVVAAVFLAVIVFAINFDKSYDWIHGILFDNYLWILNPATDNLAWLMPVEMITETAGAILTSWAVISMMLAVVFYKKDNGGFFAFFHTLLPHKK